MFEPKNEFFKHGKQKSATKTDEFCQHVILEKVRDPGVQNSDFVTHCDLLIFLFVKGNPFKKIPIETSFFRLWRA